MSKIIHECCEKVGSAYQLKISSTSRIPLLNGGMPVEQFNEGWTPSFLYGGFDPVFVLQLKHDNGTVADWFLDQEFNRISGSFDLLPEALKSIILVQSGPLVELLLGSVIGTIATDPPAEAIEFTCLSPQSRIQIFTACASQVMPVPRQVLLSTLPDTIPFLAAGNRKLSYMSRKHITSAFSTSFQDRIIESTRDGLLKFPSPVSGTDVAVQNFLCFDDFRYMYRLVEPDTGLSYFVVATDHIFYTVALYFPTLGLIIFPDERSQKSIFPAHFGSFHAGLVNHIAYLSPWLCKLTGRTVSRIGAVFRGHPNAHIGHQLYNEMGGAQRLIETAPGPLLPDWFVFGDGVELWGPLDQVFPQLEGKIVRNIPILHSVVKYAYSNDICLVRVTDAYVSAALRENILRVARQTEPYLQAKLQITNITQSRAPIILIGLRVENRTLSDLGDFCMKMVGRIAAVYPGAVLVVDGKNSSESGALILSNSEPSAQKSPFLVEKEIAAIIAKACVQHGLVAIDNIGESLQKSLAWTEHAACFISIWGASLAKYRWICNKKGFTITGHWNVTNRSDLHIYDDTSYMDSPSELTFVSKDMVRDDQTATPLVNARPGDLSTINFTVDEEPFFQALMVYLRGEIG